MTDKHNTIAIVQARMNSSRLPGKSLALIAGTPLLQMLLTRLNKAKTLDHIVVATSTEKHDDPISGFCRENNISCVRGSENDVLGRFLHALEQFSATNVVRICADNPLTDPEVIDDLVGKFKASTHDYAYNNLPECGYPDGVAGEIVRAKSLQMIADETCESQDREHVTVFIRRHPDRFRTIAFKAPKHLHCPDIRLDVDYAEDLHCLNTLCEVLPSATHPYWSTEEIIAAIEKHPGIMHLRKATSYDQSL